MPVRFTLLVVLCASLGVLDPVGAYQYGYDDDASNGLQLEAFSRYGGLREYKRRRADPSWSDRSSSLSSSSRSVTSASVTPYGSRSPRPVRSKVMGVTDGKWKRWMRRVRGIAFRITLLSVAISLARRRGLMQIYVHNFYPQLRPVLRKFLEIGDQVVETGEHVLDVVGKGAAPERLDRGWKLLPSIPTPRLLPESREENASKRMTSYLRDPTQDDKLQRWCSDVTSAVGNVVDAADLAAGEVIDTVISKVGNTFGDSQPQQEQPERQRNFVIGEPSGQYAHVQKN